MSMFKKPLNLNFHLVFKMADKMAEIFEMAATEGLNYSFSSYISLAVFFFCLAGRTPVVPRNRRDTRLILIT